MICNNCNHNKVCKHFDYVSRYGISIGGCPFAVASTVMPMPPRSIGNPTLSGGYRESLKTKKEPKKENTIKCPTCDGIDYESKITICETCSKPICGNCSIEADGELLCNDCYKGEI